MSITKYCSNFCFVFICSRPFLANFVKHLGFFKTLLLKGTLKCLQSIFMSYWTKGLAINIYCIDRLKLSILAIHWEFWDITKCKFCKIISSLRENLIKLRENCHFMEFAKISCIVLLSIEFLLVSLQNRDAFIQFGASDTFVTQRSTYDSFSFSCTQNELCTVFFNHLNLYVIAICYF